MSTTRERKEARAARRLEWAEGREAKAETAAATVQAISDAVPFGQPILVGHHSEKRHRAAIKRQHNAMDKLGEHTAMADKHRRRAAGIEGQLATSIYSDDLDAIEALRERIAGLEAKREAMKTANAAFRSEHKAALRAMSPFMRGQSMPHPPYELSNLGGNLSRNRARLAELERAA